MGIKSKRAAEDAVRTRVRIVDGKEYRIYDSYLGTDPITKKPIRFYASSRAELKDKMDAYYDQRKSLGDLSAVLTAEQVMDARLAILALSDAGVKATLLDCAKAQIQYRREVLCSGKSLGEAYAEYVSSKHDQSADEISKTKTIVGKWVERCGSDTQVCTVTTKSVLEYLKTNFDALAPRTYNANLSYIGTFLRWCGNPARRYISSDPCADIAKRAVAWQKPRYMKPAEVERLMRLLESEAVVGKHPEYLALAVTQLFVGTRRVEAMRAKDSDAATIILEDETFRVDKGKGYTKNKAPRTAHMEPNAVAWMKSFDYFGALSRVGKNTTQNLYNFARANGVGVFQNFMRHTFITMHVAKFHTPQVTQSMVGTSGSMRAEHYDGLAPQREGEEYFSIFPSRSA